MVQEVLSCQEQGSVTTGPPWCQGPEFPQQHGAMSSWKIHPWGSTGIISVGFLFQLHDVEKHLTNDGGKCKKRRKNCFV